MLTEASPVVGNGFGHDILVIFLKSIGFCHSVKCMMCGHFWGNNGLKTKPLSKVPLLLSYYIFLLQLTVDKDTLITNSIMRYNLRH